MSRLDLYAPAPLSPTYIHALDRGVHNYMFGGLILRAEPVVHGGVTTFNMFMIGFFAGDAGRGFSGAGWSTVFNATNVTVAELNAIVERGQWRRQLPAAAVVVEALTAAVEDCNVLVAIGSDEVLVPDKFSGVVRSPIAGVFYSALGEFAEAKGKVVISGATAKMGGQQLEARVLKWQAAPMPARSGQSEARKHALAARAIAAANTLEACAKALKNGGPPLTSVNVPDLVGEAAFAVPGDEIYDELDCEEAAAVVHARVRLKQWIR